MMRDEDIGRVLDEWFVEGPTQMPSRFFNATFVPPLDSFN